MRGGGVCIELRIPHVLLSSIQLPLPHWPVYVPSLYVPFLRPSDLNLCRIQTEGTSGTEVLPSFRPPLGPRALVSGVAPVASGLTHHP